MRKLLSPDMGGVAIQATDKRSRCPGWIALDEQVDMIWHDLQRVNYQPILGSLLAQQSLQAFRYGPDEHGAAIFRTPHRVVLQREYRPSVFPVCGHDPRYMPTSNHKGGSGASAVA